ncbi:MAG: DHH family phosphoesterase [Candidatus Hadarchaeales archaeon]
MKEAAGFLTEACVHGKRILVLCHYNADPDAVASAVVLSEILKKLGAQTKAGASENISSAAQTLLEAYGKKVEIDPALDVDLVVLVDTSSFEHLGGYGETLRSSGADIMVIDHHRPVEEMKKLSKMYFVVEEFTSESELIFRLASEMKQTLTPDQASLLLAGILTDTGFFRLAKPETFEVVNSLLKAGAEYDKIVEIMKPPEDFPKRVAILKGAGRSELHRIQGKLIVFSELGSFEGEMANVLLKIGADVAFVGSEDKDGVRMSGRGRPEIIKETGLHLGEIMENLGKSFQGSGGGHAGAASFTGKGTYEEVKKHILRELERKLNRGGAPVDTCSESEIT